MDLKPDHDYRVTGRPMIGKGSAEEPETFDRLTYWGTFGFFSPGDLSSRVPIEAFWIDRQWVLFKPDTFKFEAIARLIESNGS